MPNSIASFKTFNILIIIRTYILVFEDLSSGSIQNRIHLNVGYQIKFSTIYFFREFRNPKHIYVYKKKKW